MNRKYSVAPIPPYQGPSSSRGPINYAAPARARDNARPGLQGDTHPAGDASGGSTSSWESNISSPLNPTNTALPLHAPPSHDNGHPGRSIK